jgi:hypothetical protein
MVAAHICLSTANFRDTLVMTLSPDLVVEHAWGFRSMDVPLEAIQPEFFAGWNPPNDRAKRQLERDGSSAYWARRFCETTDDGGNAASMRVYAQAVALVASEDPFWIMEAWHVELANLLQLHGRATSVLTGITRRIHINDPAIAHYAKGKLWVASMHKAMPSSLSERGKRALVHLRKVSKELRATDWLNSLCVAASWGDYPLLRASVGSYIGQGENTFRRKEKFRIFLAAAAREEDWPTYDEVRHWYAELYENPGVHDTEVDAASIAALDGFRALLLKKNADLEVALAKLARLSGQWLLTRGLVVAVAKRRIAVESCRRCLNAQIAAGMPLGSLTPAIRRLLET